MNILEGKKILLTGGTGSFGNKFTEILLKEYNPDTIRIFSRNERYQVEMQRKFCNDERIRFLVGDVRDKDRLHRAMQDIDIVIHSAALKHVPVCEYNPIEAIKTNIDGAINIIDVAISNNVDRVMAISTDKAVHPVNLYGATKMVAEKLFVQANTYSYKKTKFSCVRYGNVICSSGSIIPLFLEQKKKGVLAVTDNSMTRFLITLEDGVNFVINSLENQVGGEIFIPKIKSMKIMDLADLIAPKSIKNIIGVRPGEKIHEVLLTEDESRHSKEYNEYFVIEPEFPFWGDYISKNKTLPTGFRYSSDNNKEWWKSEDMMKIIEDYK